MGTDTHQSSSFRLQFYCVYPTINFNSTRIFIYTTKATTMLIRSLLFTAGLVLSAAAAHVDLVARQTPPAKQKFQAIVPRAPEPTAAPPPRWAALGMGSLFERDVSLGTNTCGYIDETSSRFRPLNPCTSNSSF